MTTPYDDIINHPHHVSRNHPQMSMHDRAAQFSPFAALVGYEDAITDAAKEHICCEQEQSEPCAEESAEENPQEQIP